MIIEAVVRKRRVETVAVGRILTDKKTLILLTYCVVHCLSLAHFYMSLKSSMGSEDLECTGGVNLSRQFRK